MWCSIAGSILLWASCRGYFSLELTWVPTPFPKNSFGWEYKPRSSLRTHAFHRTDSKDPDIHVLDGWMLATKTHPACTIRKDGMWLPWRLDFFLFFYDHIRKNLTKNGEPQRYSWEHRIWRIGRTGGDTGSSRHSSVRRGQCSVVNGSVSSATLGCLLRERGAVHIRFSLFPISYTVPSSWLILPFWVLYIFFFCPLTLSRWGGTGNALWDISGWESERGLSSVTQTMTLSCFNPLSFAPAKSAQRALFLSRSLFPKCASQVKPKPSTSWTQKKNQQQQTNKKQPPSLQESPPKQQQKTKRSHAWKMMTPKRLFSDH